MEEEWRPIAEFQNYLVSNHGRVLNENFGRIMTLSMNQYGVLHVGLFRENVQSRRSVAHLVANAFLPAPKYDTFNTVINKDGDRCNNFVTNLEWRPKWFTVKFHAQFRDRAVDLGGRIADMETGQQFASVWDVATEYGLLVKDVLESMANHTYVWPTGQRFWRVD